MQSTFWRLFCVFMVVLGVSGISEAGVEVGDRPFFSLKSIDKKNIRNTSYRDKILVVMFWASHHPQCVAIGDHVRAIRRAYQKNDVEMIGISFDNSPKKAKETAERLRFNWPQICDGLGWLSPLRGQWGVKDLPYCVVIGPKGKVLWTGSMFEVADELPIMMKQHLYRLPPKDAPFKPMTQQSIEQFQAAAKLIQHQGQYSRSFDLFLEIPSGTFSNPWVLKGARPWMDLLTGPHADKAAIQSILKKRQDVVAQIRQLYLGAEKVEKQHAESKRLYESGKAYEKSGDEHSAYFMIQRALMIGPESEVGDLCVISIQDYHQDKRFRVRYLQKHQAALKMFEQAEKFDGRGQLTKAIGLYERVLQMGDGTAWCELSRDRIKEIRSDEAKKVNAGLLR